MIKFVAFGYFHFKECSRYTCIWNLQISNTNYRCNYCTFGSISNRTVFFFNKLGPGQSNEIWFGKYPVR